MTKSPPDQVSLAEVEGEALSHVSKVAGPGTCQSANLSWLPVSVGSVPFPSSLTFPDHVQISRSLALPCLALLALRQPLPWCLPGSSFLCIQSPSSASLLQNLSRSHPLQIWDLGIWSLKVPALLYWEDMRCQALGQSLAFVCVLLQSFYPFSGPPSGLPWPSTQLPPPRAHLLLIIFAIPLKLIAISVFPGFTPNCFYL